MTTGMTAGTGTTIRVAVVEDEEEIARVLADRLGREPDMAVVGVAHTGAEALEVIERAEPAVVLLDLDLPVVKGIEVLRRTKGAGTRFVVLTRHDDDAHLFEALAAGARGYLVKRAALRGEEPTGDVVDAVRQVAQGYGMLPPGLAGRFAEEFERVSRQAAMVPALLNLMSLLTPREAEILRFVAERRTNREIGALLDRDLQTVKTHVTNILQKLEVNSRVEAALLAERSGLLLAPGRPPGTPFWKKGRRDGPDSQE